LEGLGWKATTAYGLTELAQEFVLDVLELVLEKALLGLILLVDEREERGAAAQVGALKELLAYVGAKVITKELCH